MARRSAGRHARRIRRITPRRWLPFVALLALAVGAVAVEGQADDPVPDTVAEAAPATLLPVAAEPGALSTAWYCAGGSATGAGPAEMSVVIANDASTGATGEITAYGTEGEPVHATVQVPANGRTRVVASDLLPSPWSALTVEVLGGRATVEREVSGPNGIDASPCSSSASSQWYIPSGSTAIGATQQIVLFNPFPDDANVDITFATDDGPRSPRALRGLSVPGGSLRVVPTESLPARRPQIATKVTARTGRVVVARIQDYDGKGDAVAGEGPDSATTGPARGLAVTAAIPTTRSRWFFPDARNDAGTRTQIAIYNPGSTSARVDVVIGYEDPSRMTEVEPIELDVRAREQTVLDLTEAAGIEDGVPYTVDVRSLDDVPVAAEQLIFGAPAPAEEVTEEVPADEGSGDEAPPEEAPEAAEPIDGFAVVAGSPVSATDWFLPSRGGSTTRASTVVVANPGSAPVTVRVTSVVEGLRKDVASARVEIPPGDRRVLDLSDTTVNPALLVSASGPVVVSHSSVVRSGVGIAQSLASPLPETVTDLPPTR